MKNGTKPIFQPLFEDELHLLKNPTCERCDAQAKKPLLPWLVGTNFLISADRIFFVGKPHRGTPGSPLPSGMIDPTDEVEGLWSKALPFWIYTRQIAENLYGSRAFDFIALTNLIKCTNVGLDEGRLDRQDNLPDGRVLHPGIGRDLERDHALETNECRLLYLRAISRDAPRCPGRAEWERAGDNVPKPLHSLPEQTARVVGANL